MDHSSGQKLISIVIPVYNEAASLQQLYDELSSVVETLPYDFEFVFVNDGSSDDSQEKLNELAAQDPRIIPIELAKNVGKEITLSAGLHNCSGDAAITMDADLQHPPRYIPQFLKEWEDGALVVVGRRKEAESRNVFRRLSTKLFYFAINYAAAVKISPDIMDFRLVDREVIDHFNRFTERNRITRGLIDWLGYSQTFIDVKIPERLHGTSTYSTRKLFKLAKDSLVSMSLLPLKVSGYLGIAITAVFGPLGVFVLIDQAFLGDNLEVSGAGSVGILTAFMIGVVLINLGLIALYIANMHDESLQRPLYVQKRNRPPAKPPSVDDMRKIVDSLAQESSTTASVKDVLGELEYEDLPPNNVSLERTQEDIPAQVDETVPREPKNPKKRILWLSWQDIGHPRAGGAELLTTNIHERLVQDGHQVTLLTGSYPDAQREETVNGVRTVRMGGRYTVHFKVMWYYLRNRKQLQADLAIDENNTAPFFIRWYSRLPTFMFYHQLTREIWFHESPQPISTIGYAAEEVYTRLLNNIPAIAVSRSTRLDLLRRGFQYRNISLISEGIRLQPVDDLASVQKFSRPTVLALGAVRSMKQTLDQIKAFETAKSALPNLQLIIAGDMDSTPYGRKVKDYIEESEYIKDIDVMGRVSEELKIELMQKSHWLLVTSIKEGWCLVVTEAASQGTPAIVYDADGLRDSVKHGETGFVVHPNPEAMAETIVEAFKHAHSLEFLEGNSNDLVPSHSPQIIQAGPGHKDYVEMQLNAWRFAKTITFDQSYEDFKRATGL